MREIVIDTETTGLSYKTGDRVIEVGCVELINHVATNKSLQFYCKVDKEISDGAQRITGITNKFLSDKKYFSDHCDDLLKFIDNDPLIIHNADFDVGFINNELSLLGRSKLSNPIVDTVSLARKVLNTRVANLDYLCRRFKVDLSERDLHGALLDSRLLAEVYLELTGGRQSSLVFKQPSNNARSVIKGTETVHKELELISAFVTKEEEKEHSIMLKKIIEPIWER